MAKDTKGHGSESRGGGGYVEAVGNSNMQHAMQASREANAWGNMHAAGALAQGHPKSAAPDGVATPPSKSMDKQLGGSQRDWETGDHYFPGLP